MLVDLFSNVGYSGGSGLGLYIAAGIVKLHEGCSLTAASPGEGQGSTFKVGIPVAEGPLNGEASSKPAPLGAESVRRERSMGSQSVKHKRLNILVVVRAYLTQLSLCLPCTFCPTYTCD